MRVFRGAKIAGLFPTAFALLAALVVAPPATALSSANSANNPESLYGAEVVAKPEALGHTERDAVTAAKAHLDINAQKWGINASQFRPTIAIDGVAGTSVVRFSQFINGAEVANSLLAITVSGYGSLLAYTKSISAFSGASQAEINKNHASDILKAKLALQAGVLPEQVNVSKVDLVIVDSALVDEVPTGKYLAWRALTSLANDASSTSMTYLSQDGTKILSTLRFVRNITEDPFVCDLQFDVSSSLNVPPGVVSNGTTRFINIASSTQSFPLCGLNTIGRNETSTEVGTQNIIRTWDYFKSVLGQDINEEKFLGNISESVNGDLKPRISAFIDICATDGINGYCPYQNAFWAPWQSDKCNSGVCSGIFLGTNFDHSDDVIAHELAHGVTFSLAFSSPMADKSETGALSEAISDIFGEATDQLTVDPGEVADPAWTIGEEVYVGGIRNLKTPIVSKIDKNWKAIDSHDNNGPVNRLAFLLANGGTVGKVKITALGTTANSSTKNDLCDVSTECSATVRMSQLVFATVSNLTASATYFEFGRAMNNACFALLKAKTPGFTAASCKTVQSALTVQGFTSSSIKLTKQASAAKAAKPFTFLTSMQAINGTKVSGQKLALQVLVGKKWVTKQSRVTNASGNAAFSVRFNSKRDYNIRVVTYSNSGLYSIISNTAKVKVS